MNTRTELQAAIDLIRAAADKPDGSYYADGVLSAVQTALLNLETPDGKADTDEQMAATLARICAFRMQCRVDIMIERDGSVDAAVTGRGVGISFLLTREIVQRLEMCSELLDPQKDAGSCQP